MSLVRTLVPVLGFQKVPFSKNENELFNVPYFFTPCRFPKNNSEIQQKGPFLSLKEYSFLLLH